MKRPNKTSLTTNGFHNFSDHDREKNDYYATDPIALKLLLQYEKFNNVWECACGEGNLSNVLRKYNLLARESDLIIRNYPCEKLDFLAYTGTWDGDIITNPPYNLFTEFAYKAIEVIKEGNKVAFFCPQRYLSSKTRYALYTKYPPYRVYAFSNRVSCWLNNNKEAISDSAIDYMWIIWVKGFEGDTVLKWISPDDCDINLFD